MRSSGLALFDEISEKVGLSEIQRDRYIRYMSKRCPNLSDWVYAKEWAERFRDGVEYQASDREGQSILALIDK